MSVRKKRKSNVGRKPKIDTLLLGKLKEAFLLGCTDTEACLYAGIHPDTLYEYQKKNPEYTEQKKLFKSNPILLARQTVLECLKADANLALKYLERKLSDEFSLKQEIKQIVNQEKITGFNYIIPKDRIEYER